MSNLSRISTMRACSERGGRGMGKEFIIEEFKLFIVLDFNDIAK